jgi:hypothetical protein
MKALSAQDSAAKDVILYKSTLYEVALAIVSAANEHRFKLPCTIEIIDAEGEVVSYDMTEDYQIIPHQEFDMVLTFPCSVVLSDGRSRDLEMVIARKACSRQSATE